MCGCLGVISRNSGAGFRPEIRRNILATIASLAAVAAILGGANQAFAAEKTVHFRLSGYDDPRLGADGKRKLEQKSILKIKWVKFGGGGDVIRRWRLAASMWARPGLAHCCRCIAGLPIKLFWILDDIANAEQLVARNGSGINSIADLKGKTVATPSSPPRITTDVRAEGSRAFAAGCEARQPAPAGNCRCLGAGRYRRDIYLGADAWISRRRRARSIASAGDSLPRAKRPLTVSSSG